MSLRSRLVAALLATALVPLIIVGVLAATSARNALEARANDQLVAIRSNKKTAIENYFATVRDQTITLAANPAVVVAMRDFRTAFDRYAEQHNDAPEPAAARAALQRFYVGEFVAKYAKENSDRPRPDTARLIGGLGPNALLLQHGYIARNANPLGSKHQLDVVTDGSDYAGVHRRIHPSLRQFVEKFGYYDIFLVDAASGDVVYSMYKELDFATNLLKGAWSRTGLADAFRAALRQPRDGFAIVDYKTYTPSYEAPAGFSATPIFDGGRRIGVLIFQLPLDRVSQVMSDRSGLGDTGETFLVGPDHLMRSDSFFDKENRSVVASFRQPERGRVDTTSARTALAGDDGVGITEDYRGNDALSAYQPVNIAGLRWALLAEMNTAEAFADVTTLTNTMLLFGAVAAAVITAFGWWFARSVANPMQKMAAVMTQVQRDGDYSRRTAMAGSDEIAQTGRAIDGLLEQLQRVFAAANGALGELAAGRFERRVEEPCQGALAALSAGINQAITGVADATRLQAAQADELARNAAAQKAQAEHLAAIAAENTRVRQALDCVSTGAMIADDEHCIVYTNTAVETLLRNAEADLRSALPNFRANAVRGQSMDVFHRDPQRQRHLLSGLQQAHRAEIVVGGRVFGLIATPILADGKRLGTVLEWADRTQERAIEREIETLVNAASAGDFSARIDVDAKDGFFATLSDGLNALLARVGSTIDGAATVLEGVANGELTSTMHGEYAGTFAVLQGATNTTIDRLTQTIRGIGDAADSAFVAAGELAESASALRSRTEQQNAALEASASSITELTESVKATAESAAMGSRLAQDARDQAARGDEVVRATVQAMDAISRTSAEIAEFTSLINEIAFQTNLLALNAAVEAARAGEQGKGFAVVAGEVRNLAHRAGEAATRIRDLIRSSSESVEEGGRMATLSGETLREVIAAFERVSQTISEVSTASNEQASNIELVARKLEELEGMTHQNAAVVEESSAAAEAVADQSRQVRELLGFFKTPTAPKRRASRSAR